MTYHRVCTRLTQRVPVVEQKLLTLPEHLGSPPVLSGVRVTRFLVLCVCFVARCLFFCLFLSLVFAVLRCTNADYGIFKLFLHLYEGQWHCVVCSSSIYGFWLPLWYLQTLLACFCLIFFIGNAYTRWKTAKIIIIMFSSCLMGNTLAEYINKCFEVETELEIKEITTHL